MAKFPLPPITDFAAYNKNTKEQYEALGQFIVAFEEMVNQARESGINLIQNEIGLVDVAFHHPALTAKPLFDIFRALVVEFLNLPELDVLPIERDTFMGVLKTIATEFFDLVNIRNTLLHGTWQIGFSTEKDPNSENFSLRKFKPTATGLEKQEDVPKHAFDLLALKDRCKDTRIWISYVHWCVPRPDQPYDRVLERFLFKDGEWQLSLAADMPTETLPRKSP